jgi:predicted metal-dependent peptidase
MRPWKGFDGLRSSSELSRQMHEWAISTEQGLCSAKACGHEPGGIQRPVEQARQSEHDWRAILRAFIASTNPSDYRWAPPNRRFVASGCTCRQSNEAASANS